MEGCKTRGHEFTVAIASLYTTPDTYLGSNARVQPPRVNGVAQKVVVLQQLGDVIANVVDFAADFDLLEGDDHGPDGRLPGAALGKQMPKLCGECVVKQVATCRSTYPLSHNLSYASCVTTCESENSWIPPPPLTEKYPHTSGVLRKLISSMDPAVGLKPSLAFSAVMRTAITWP